MPDQRAGQSTPIEKTTALAGSVVPDCQPFDPVTVQPLGMRHASLARPSFAICAP
jgi:hypothetical protein